MSVALISLAEDYWLNFTVTSNDVEFLYNDLLDKEIPLTSHELIVALVKNRIRQEKQTIERQRLAGGDVYLPKGSYQAGQSLVFPSLNWKHGKVVEKRPGINPDIGEFEVIQVAFEDGENRSFAAGLQEHVLNAPPDQAQDEPGLDIESVLGEFGEDLQAILEDELQTNPDFVRIAGKWFPRALLIDINAGHLNLAEAVLDMSGGGPLPTLSLLDQLGLASQDNTKLVEFSLDLALQEDQRFDEVGPAGQVLWFLNRLEPEDVRTANPFLRYTEIPFDRALLTPDMVVLERQLDDELSPFVGKSPAVSDVIIPLIFPHWRAGTLPLSQRVRHLFPTAYEAPRIRFMLVDGDSGQKFPGWVVRSHRYVYGLKEWFQAKNAFPGSQIRIRKGANPGEVIVHCETRRPLRDWVRTVLVGSDGGVVFAMLKQNLATGFDERLTIAVPDANALEQVWLTSRNDNQSFERVVTHVARELVKLTPQNHVHASELYAAVNTIRRCPPGPILAILASSPTFKHVGDLHFRFDDAERS
jgi:hypothetical protein